MTKWSANQVIVKIPIGGAQAVNNLAKGLSLKPGVSFTVVDWTGGIQIPEIGALTQNDRLYIVAHGNEDGTTAAGLTGEVMAGQISEIGGLGKDVGLISLVICRAGKEASGIFGSAKNYFNPSFARSFHYTLGKLCSTPTTVHARSETVSIFLEDQVNEKHNLGRKMLIYYENLKDKDNMTAVGWRTKGSKFKYQWVNGSQVITQVYDDDKLGWKTNT